MRPVALFVYGTLKRGAGGTPHRLLRGATFVRRASMSGTLYDLGKYPGVVRTVGGRQRVFGELYELPAETAERALVALDRYEGSEYVRRRVFVTVSSGRRRAAWTYVLRERPPSSAKRLASGRYPGKRGAA